MSDAMKRKQVRVYLDKDDQRRFDDLVTPEAAAEFWAIRPSG